MTGHTPSFWAFSWNNPMLHLRPAAEERMNMTLLRRLTPIVGIALAFSLTACSTNTTAPQSDPSSTSEQVSANTRTVTDLRGVEVEIPATVNKVAASFPAMEEAFLMLGVQDKNVSAIASNQKNPWMLKLYPQIADLPNIFGESVNMESLLAAAPDVVFVGDEKTQQSLIDAGIPAVQSNFKSAQDVIDGLTLMGEIFGGDAQKIAANLVSDYQTNMSFVKGRTDAITTADRPRVFYAAKSTLNTEGAGSIVTDWIEMAGGVNVATENGIEGTFKDITLEDLFAWDPEVIVARDAAHKTEYMSDSRFADLQAVKNNRVYVNPKGVFVWCVRSADEVLQPVWAATVIQPELFGDVDMNKYTYDFYSTYYHYDASDEDLQSILFPTE